MSEPYTNADALAARLCDLDGCRPAPCADHLSTAGAALKWLANQGRLTPDEVERHEVWNVRLPKPNGNFIIDDSMTKSWPPEPGEMAGDVRWWRDHTGLVVVPVKRYVVEYADGSRRFGPWVEVDEGGTDVERFLHGVRQAHDADPDEWHRGMMRPPAPRSERCEFCGVPWAGKDGTE